MQAREDRIAPIAALVAMVIVSVAIVGLTYWSGDVFGPWTSVPPAVIEQGSVGATQSMRKQVGTVDSAASLQRPRGKNGPDAGMEMTRKQPGASALRQAVKDAE